MPRNALRNGIAQCSVLLKLLYVRASFKTAKFSVTLQFCLTPVEAVGAITGSSAVKSIDS